MWHPSDSFKQREEFECRMTNQPDGLQLEDQRPQEQQQLQQERKGVGLGVGEGEMETRAASRGDSEADPPSEVKYNGLKEMLQQEGNGVPAGQVPANFVLPPHLQPGLSAKGDPRTAGLPVIDMAGVHESSERRRQVVASIAEACKEWGFFQVVGHDVPLDLRQGMLGLGREFFELPVSEKVKYQTGEKDISKPILGRSRATTSGHHSWRDLFQHRTYPVSDADVAKWPTTPESYREMAIEYTQATKNLGTSLLELIAEGLNVKSQRICEALGGVDEMEYIMMMAYYPQCPQPDLALGLIGHSDPNLITLLIEDHVGLEVRKDGLWIPVVSVPGGIVVNIGDSLQIMTNNKYASAEHRVLASEKRDRVSVMMFVQPKANVQVTVIPDLVPSNTTAIYHDIAYSLYLNYARQGLDNKLTELGSKKKTDYY